MFILYGKKNPRGFTLIELLVVVAIIGILASVVIASLNLARAKGREAAIKSNLKNMIPQVELSYDTNNNYSGACAAVANMLAGVTSQGATPNCYSHNIAGDVNMRWGASARLNSDSTKNWYVDQNGVATWDVADQATATWTAAIASCVATGGRLPSVEPFRALWLAYGTNPTPSFTASSYWTSTQDPNSSANAYTIYQNGGGAFGNVLPVTKSTVLGVRCVR